MHIIYRRKTQCRHTVLEQDTPFTVHGLKIFVVHGIGTFTQQAPKTQFIISLRMLGLC